MAELGRMVERGRTVDFCNYIPVQISAMDELLEMEVSVAECGGTASSAEQDNDAVFEKVLIHQTPRRRL